MSREHNNWTKVFQRRVSRRWLLRSTGIAGMGAMALSIASCANQTTPTQERTSSATGQPRYGGILRLTNPLDADDLEVQMTDASAIVFAGVIYDRIIQFDIQDDYKLVPGLAETWEQPDDLTYTFRLRKGVKFHNVPPVNGRELTSADVKWSIERIMTPEPLYRRHTWFKGAVNRIEVPDNYTVKFSMSAPFAPFLYYLANPWTSITGKEVIDKFGNLNEVAIGTGPFLFKKWTRNVEIEHVKNADYWDKSRPYVDQYRVSVIPDASTRVSAFSAGNLEVITIDTKDELKLVNSTMPNAQVFRQPVKRWVMMEFHTEKKPWDDVRVRKAVDLAIDRAQIIRIAGNGEGVADPPIPAADVFALPQDELLKMPGYRQPKDQDIAEAKKLLAAAGVPEGFKFKCMVTAGVRIQEDSLVLVQEQLKKIGLELEIETLEYTAKNKRRTEGNFESLLHVNAGRDDIDDFLYNYHHSRGPLNFQKYKDPKLDEYIDKQRVTLDFEKRRQIAWEAQRYMLQVLPRIYIWSPVQWVIQQPYVRNYSPPKGAEVRDAQRWPHVWLDK